MVPFSRANAIQVGPSRRPSLSSAPTCFDHSCSQSGGSSIISFTSGISCAGASLCAAVEALGQGLLPILGVELVVLLPRPPGKRESLLLDLLVLLSLLGLELR